MAVPTRYFGRQGLARYLEISTTRVAQINPPPDILVDGAPGWSSATAARIKLERERRRAKRQAGKGFQTPGVAGVG